MLGVRVRCACSPSGDGITFTFTRTKIIVKTIKILVKEETAREGLCF